MKRIFTALALLVCLVATGQEQLYKVTLLRAKPGALLQLIDVIKQDFSKHKLYVENKPYLLRHSQGDHWDLMVIHPISSLDRYFSSDQMRMRRNSLTFEQPYGDEFFNYVSFQEEAIVTGPEKGLFTDVMEQQSLFHIEIFTALEGKQKELLKQRERENIFYAGIDHKPNFIFTRVFGPSWDIFTIGGYKDMHDFAGPAVPFDVEDKAAKDAGFEGVNFIGSYLRSLIGTHHDTLAKKVK
jgi:hypothetical protein